MTLSETSINDCNAAAVDGRDGGLSALKFVLVETSRPGNIGAVARAMKTMGFSQLVLVRPRFADAASHPEAIAFASGAQDVLAGAQVVDSIEEALAGCNFAAAVSARLREFSPPVATPRALAEQLVAAVDCRAALVFGNERYGLPNTIVEKCNVLINIPANPAYSSLNLAQAVQIVAYECAIALLAGRVPAAPVTTVTPVTPTMTTIGEAAGLVQIEALYVHLEEALIALEFLDPANPKKLMSRLRRLFSRTGLEIEEVNILRGIANRILRRRSA